MSDIAARFVRRFGDSRVADSLADFQFLSSKAALRLTGKTSVWFSYNLPAPTQGIASLLIWPYYDKLL